ncbi:MAG: hypothetical protein AAF726_07380 [Planctomycetota bacterium]
MEISSQRFLSQPAAAQVTRAASTPSPARAEAAQAARAARGASSPEAASHLARRDGLSDALFRRIEAAAADAPASEQQAFRDIGESLESAFARLRAGLADGTLDPADVQRGLTNALEAARETLASTRSAEGDAPELGDIVRGRFADLAASVQARVDGLVASDDERAVAATAVADAFMSAAARLDAALFDPRTGAPIDRGTFRDLFAASLGTLQEQLTDLLGDANGADVAFLYGADSARESVAVVGRSVDLDG